MYILNVKSCKPQGIRHLPVAVNAFFPDYCCSDTAFLAAVWRYAERFEGPLEIACAEPDVMVPVGYEPF